MREIHSQRVSSKQVFSDEVTYVDILRALVPGIIVSLVLSLFFRLIALLLLWLFRR